MLSRLITGICAVAGSFAGMQFPAFYSQYLQYVSGRLTQVMRDLRPVIQDAQAQGVEVRTYLERAAAQSSEYTDTMVEGHMRAYQELQRLEDAYGALSEAGPAMQPFALARHISLADAETVLSIYTPSLPLTTEGLAFGGTGLLIGLLAAWVLESPLRVWQEMRRKRRLRRRHHRRAQRGSELAQPSETME